MAEIDILSMAGVLPPMPAALEEAGGIYAVEYTSPLTRAQKASDGVAIMRTLEQAGPVIAADPEAALVFKGKGAEIIRALGEVNGMSPTLINSAEEVEALAEADRQQQQVQQILAAAPLAADTAKTMAETAAMTGRQPQMIEAA